MRATGIVRRMDDLGRVVIPKELRRSMRIKEGAPLEIFTHNGAVCFKPYSPIGEKDWAKAKSVVEVMLTCDFALLDYYNEIQAITNNVSQPLDKEIGIVVDGDTVAFLAVNSEETANMMSVEIPNAVKVLQKLFADEV